MSSIAMTTVEKAHAIENFERRHWSHEEIASLLELDLDTVKRLSRFVHDVKLVLGKAAIVLVLASASSGCGLFVRDVDAWGFKMTFPEGLDVHAGTNSIDRVDDRRGVSPIVEQRSKRY